MASPWILATRFSEPNHCFEMSSAAAIVMKKKGFNARVVPCGFIGLSDDEVRVVMGHDVESYRNLLEKNGCSDPPDLSWLDRNALSLHAIVEVQYADLVTRIDLTAAQFSKILGAPPIISWNHRGWPTLQFSRGRGMYTPCPYPEKVPDHTMESGYGALSDAMWHAVSYAETFRGRAVDFQSAVLEMLRMF